MRAANTIVVGIFFLILAGCSMPLQMQPPAKLQLAGLKQHAATAGLYVPADVKNYVYEISTSPLDKMSYPIGKQTEEMFRRNLHLVFKKVVAADSTAAAAGVAVIVKPTIVDFNAVVPMPAYNPYTASVIYHVVVYNRQGEKIYAQTVTGKAQTSKGMLSGFLARSISAEVAQMAMNDAMKKIVQGLSDADELQNLTSSGRKGNR